MKISLSGGEFHGTYETSHDFQLNIPWCVIQDEVWHIRLPQEPKSRETSLSAYPVCAVHEPGKWRWCLVVGTQHFPLYHRCMSPARPPYPQRGTTQRCKAVLYFTTLTGFAPPPSESRLVHSRPCDLLLLRA